MGVRRARRAAGAGRPGSGGGHHALVVLPEAAVGALVGDVADDDDSPDLWDVQSVERLRALSEDRTAA